MPLYRFQIITGFIKNKTVKVEASLHNFDNYIYLYILFILYNIISIFSKQFFNCNTAYLGPTRKYC